MSIHPPDVPRPAHVPPHPPDVGTFSIQLPVPSMELSRNGRLDRRSEEWQALKREQQLRTRNAIQTATGGRFPVWPAASLYLVLVVPAPSHNDPDLDNVLTAVKTGIDQLAALGIIPDDKPRYLHPITLDYQQQDVIAACVRLRFTRRTEDPALALPPLPKPIAKRIRKRQELRHQVATNLITRDGGGRFLRMTPQEYETLIAKKQKARGWR